MNYFEVLMFLRKRAKFDTLSNRGKNKVKEQIYCNFLFFFEFLLNTYGLTISSIELKLFNGHIITNYNDELISNNVKKEKYALFRNNFTIDETEQNNDADQVAMNDVVIYQYAKDKANLSDAAYISFRAKINNTNRKLKLTSLNKLNTFKKKLNQFFKIETNSLGCYINAYDKIKFTLKKIYQHMIETDKIIENNTFNIHLSGDGCSITKTKLNLLTFCFKVLNYRDESTSGLFKLGIFLIKKENYETIDLALKEIVANLKINKTIKLDDKLFNLEFTQGGDLKWISLINGVNGANSNHPCPWCPWNKNESLDTAQNWKINDRSHLINSIKLKEINNEGYINKPIIDFIEYEKTIIDPLHLFLRITDKLFEKFIGFLESQEGKGCDLRKRPLFKRFGEIFEIECSISNPFYLSKNEQQAEMRSLNQNERIKFFKALTKKNIIDRFPELYRKDEDMLLLFNFVFNEFFSLFIYLKNDYTEIIRVNNTARFKSRLLEWLKMYLKVGGDEIITPYIHSFVFHVPEFLERYKNLNFFSTQALEKLNSVTKTHFFRNTNKKRNMFLQQLLEKANRIEFINLKGTTAELYQKINNN